MTKPTSRWAIAMWVAAGLYVFALAVRILGVNGAYIAHGGLISLIWEMFGSGALSVGTLSGLGALIELVDQIRWDAAHRENSN
jgi:hypothetical protein